jgi:hypothetical protein
LTGDLYPKNEITVFEGGSHSLDLSFYSTFFMGQTARSRNFGNTISSSLMDTHLIGANPAGTTRSKRNLLTFDISPGFGFDLYNNFPMISDGVNNAIDDVLETDASDDIIKSYPAINTSIGQAGWINQLGLLVYDERYGTFGLSWHRPFFLNIDFLGNGMNFTVQDNDVKQAGTPNEYTETTLLPLSIELFNSTTISMHQTDISYGREINDIVSVGAGLSFSSLEIYNSLDAKIGGFIRQYGGDVDIYVAFDDPNVLYRNTMNSFMDVDFRGNFIGGIISGSFTPTPQWFLDVALETSRSKQLSGHLNIVQHKLYALDLFGDGEETLDVELLQPAQIAYTNRTEYISDDMKLSIPGKFAMSSAFVTKNDIKLIFGYEMGFSELRLDYSCVRIEDGQKKDENGDFVYFNEETELRYSVGMKPKHTVKLAIGGKYFALSAQVMVSDLIADGMTDSDGEPVEPISNMVIPGLAIGYTIHLSKNTMLDLSLIALPAPFFRSSLSWKF